MSGHDEIYDLDGNPSQPPAQVWEEDRDGKRILRLQHPVTIVFKTPHGEREDVVSILEIRRVKGADVRAFIKCKHDEEKVLITMFMRLTGHEAVVFDRMDADDIMAFSEAIQDFLQKYPQTGRG